MGVIQFNLDGSEKDHNYNVECEMGSVKISGTDIAAIAKEKYIDNNAASEYDISCGMGSVLLKFKE